MDIAYSLTRSTASSTKSLTRKMMVTAGALQPMGTIILKSSWLNQQTYVREISNVI